MYTKLLSFSILLLIAGTLRAAPAAGANGPLTPGNRVERELKGQERHSYSITLAKDELLWVEAEQISVDVAVALKGPEGTELLRLDRPAVTVGIERVWYVAARAGVYELLLEGVEPDGLGRYAVQIKEQRTAQAKDRTRARAWREYEKAVRLYHEESLLRESVATAEKSLRLMEQAAGRNSTEWAETAYYLATLYHEAGSAEAQQLLQETLNVQESLEERKDLEVARTLDALATVETEMRRLKPARDHYQRALTIREKIFQGPHPDIAATHDNLASLYQERGLYQDASAERQKALKMAHDTLPPENPGVAESLRNAAGTETLAGQYADALTHYRAALELARKNYARERQATDTLSANLPARAQELADTLDGLGALLVALRFYDEAEPLYQEELQLLQELPEPHPADVALAYSGLANLYNEKLKYRPGDDDKPAYQLAEGFYRQAMALLPAEWERDGLATVRQNYALLLADRGRVAQARQAFRQAQTALTLSLGRQHPKTGLLLNNFGAFHLSLKEYRQAEKLLLQALAVLQKSHGPQHPDVAKAKRNLARLRLAQNNPSAALTLLQESQEINRKSLPILLYALTAQQKEDLIAGLRDEQDLILTLRADYLPDDETAQRLAAAAVFALKGRTLDAQSQQLGALRRHATPATESLWADYADNQAAQAQPLDDSAGAALQEQAKSLEQQLIAQSQPFAAQSADTRANLDELRQHLPAGVALVEYARYRPSQAATGQAGPERYAAFVVTAENGPRFVELGAAQEIDAGVEALRQALAPAQCLNGPIDRACLAQTKPEIRQAGRDWDEKIFRPARALAGAATHWLVAPDSQLNLLPFAALVSEQDKYLVQTHTISYLTSARDILRLAKLPARRAPSAADGLWVAVGSFFARQPLAAPGAPSVGFAPYDYDHDAETARQRGEPNPLPGSQDEAGQLAELDPATEVWAQKEATEEKFKSRRSPYAVHIASHAEFGGAAASNTAADTRLLARSDVPLSPLPMLRSRVLLAPSDTEDGNLTALELATWDGYGTELAVLSACQTGLGEAQAGEGVYGLRRALVLAGTRTQVTTLWDISNRATQRLMENFYGNLTDKQDRAVALRQAQLDLVNSADYGHPYYWAAFSLSGAWLATR